MQKKHETKALNKLNSDRPTTNGVERHLHEIVGKITTRRTRAWHSGFLSLPGFFRESISFYQKSGLTTTLFVKRTT